MDILLMTAIKTDRNISAYDSLVDRQVDLAYLA